MLPTPVESETVVAAAAIDNAIYNNFNNASNSTTLSTRPLPSVTGYLSEDYPEYSDTERLTKQSAAAATEQFHILLQVSVSDMVLLFLVLF